MVNITSPGQRVRLSFEGGDYTALPGTVTLNAYAASKIIIVAPLGDANPEPSETVIVTLTAGTGYIVGSPSSATVNIADND